MSDGTLHGVLTAIIGAAALNDCDRRRMQPIMFGCTPPGPFLWSILNDSFSFPPPDGGLALW